MRYFVQKMKIYKLVLLNLYMILLNKLDHKIKTYKVLKCLFQLIVINYYNRFISNNKMILFFIKWTFRSKKIRSFFIIN